MQVPSLHIQSTHGKIGLQSQRPHIQIQQHHAEFSIHQEHVDTLKISTRAGKMFIDQTEAFADANLKGGLRSSKEFLAKTNQKVSQYIQKKAHEGNQFMRIERSGGGGAVIARIATQNSELYPERQAALTQMPRPFQVKFQFEPTQVNIQARRSEPNIHVNKREPTIQLPKWQVDAYVRQKNEINIQVVGLQLNQQF